MAEPQAAAAQILFVGDVVGGLGLRTLLDCLPLLRERYAPTFVIVNAENIAGGIGITPKIFDELLAEVSTSHARRPHLQPQGHLPRPRLEPRIVRPANLCAANPATARAWSNETACASAWSTSAATSTCAPAAPFAAADVALGELPRGRPRLVDMHAEATSEKVAMGWHLDGRVTAVFGTHTHIPTADAKILPGGTAYITDVGMTGPRGGVIGVKREQAIESLLTQMPVRFETSEEDPWLMGALVSCSQRLQADSIEQVLMPRPPGPLTAGPDGRPR